MKNNKITLEQWGLEQCIMHGLLGLDEAAQNYFRENPEYDDEFGRWIRNSCKLWEHGTAKCVADIIQAYRAGRITSKHLDDHDFVHPDLPHEMEDYTRMTNVDYKLTHPDNCSAVIVEQIFQRLHDGC